MKMRLMAKHYAYQKGLVTPPTHEDGEWLVGGNAKKFTDRQLEKFTEVVRALRDSTKEKLEAQSGETIS